MDVHAKPVSRSATIDSRSATAFAACERGRGSCVITRMLQSLTLTELECRRWLNCISGGTPVIVTGWPSACDIGTMSRYNVRSVAQTNETKPFEQTAHCAQTHVEHRMTPTPRQTPPLTPPSLPALSSYADKVCVSTHRATSKRRCCRCYSLHDWFRFGLNRSRDARQWSGRMC